MGKWKYGVILDAGSSGTRIHVYRWLKYSRAIGDASDAALNRLPVVGTKKHYTKKVHPGISTYGEKVDQVGPDHLLSLFEHALEIVPKDEVKDTPIFLLATAGMRLLPDGQRVALLAEICNYARTTTNFQLPDCDLHIQVIPGETEGLYGWIAANYLLNAFDQPGDHGHGKAHHTYGFLDMGGASAQIAFAPNSTEAAKHPEDLSLLRLRSLDGRALEFKVFVTTWLGFGVHEARRRYLEALIESIGSDSTQEIPDPCLPEGLKISIEGEEILQDADSAAAHLLGTGKFLECVHQTHNLLTDHEPCDSHSCLFSGKHFPAIDFEINHFVGVSEYWHTTHEIFEMEYKDKAYDFKTYQDRVNDFCTRRWSDIKHGVEDHEWGEKVDESKAAEACFKASWLINMLHEGIGIPRQGIEQNGTVSNHNTTTHILDNAAQEGYLAPFQAVNKIDDTEVSWTLGKMVLYASSQVPPAADSLKPVGFGSNDPASAEAFHLAGGRPDPISDYNDSFSGSGDKEIQHDDYDSDVESDDEDWHDKILNSDIHRRTPGILLFVLILLIIAFVLLGRERRANVYRKFKSLWDGSGFRRRGGGLSSKLPFGLGGRNSAKYERLLEEGDMPHPSDFELRSVSNSSHSASDSDNTDGTGGQLRSSSRQSDSSGSSFRRSRFANGTSGSRSKLASPGGVGLSLGGNNSTFFDNPNAGLGLNLGESTGHRSRNASPTRWRTPAPGTVKEGID